MSPSYRMAVVGCGGMGGAYTSVCAEIPDVQVVAVADVRRKKLDAFATKWEVTSGYTDYREMLEKEQLDLLGVCTWEDSHCEIVEAAAQCGVRGILCEKPMAMDLGEADRMIAACDSAGVKLAIGHMRRYFPTYRKAKHLIDSRQLGDVQFMWAYCGGWDIFLWGVHYADMLHFLNNDCRIEWVIGQLSWKERGMAYPYSEGARRSRGERFITEDSAMGLMRFENGVRAILETGVHSPKDYRAGDRQHLCELSVYGTSGMVVVSDCCVRYRTSADQEWAGMEVDSYRPMAQSAYKAELEELICCIETGAEHQLNARRGRAALEMIMAVFESSRSRAVVEIPLTVQDNPFVSMARQGMLS